MSNERPIALWAVPRSISTAFERVFIERGDFRVLHEPFSMSYYFSPERRSEHFDGEEIKEEYRYENVLSEVLDRRIIYARPSVPEFVSAARAGGLTWGFAAVMVGIYTVARLGFADTVTDDIARVLERPPATLRQFTADHRAAWA